MDPPFFSPIDRNGNREYNDNATSVADRAKRGIRRCVQEVLISKTKFTML